MTIRNVDEGLKRRLRIRAAENGRSMSAEAAAILRAALVGEPVEAPRDLYAAIRASVAPVGGLELERPQLEDVGEPRAIE